MKNKKTFSIVLSLLIFIFFYSLFSLIDFKQMVITENSVIKKNDFSFSAIAYRFYVPLIFLSIGIGQLIYSKIMYLLFGKDLDYKQGNLIYKNKIFIAIFVLSVIYSF